MAKTVRRNTALENFRETKLSGRRKAATPLCSTTHTQGWSEPFINSVYTELQAVKLPNLRSYTVDLHGSGQPYASCLCHHTLPFAQNIFGMVFTFFIAAQNAPVPLCLTMHRVSATRRPSLGQKTPEPLAALVFLSAAFLDHLHRYRRMESNEVK